MLKFKNLAIVLNLILSLSCSLLALPNNVVYLIPKDFTGGVIILYNQPDGITPETDKDGNIIYLIPKDGLLKVREKFERKNFKFKYYFVDDKDNRTEVEYLYPKYYVRNLGDTTSKSFDTISEDETSNKTFAMINEISNFNIKDGHIFMNSFVIGKPVNFGTEDFKMQSKMFDIQREILGVKKEILTNP